MRLPLFSNASDKYYTLLGRLDSQSRQIELLQTALGRVESNLDKITTNEKSPLSEHEFKVFSQWGEDGILDYLTRVVPLSNKRFVEFGVEDYRESTTRFLLAERHWSGVVIDGSNKNMAALRNQDIYWRHNLKEITSFVTKDNINGLLKAAGIEGDIGLLVIDIDGVDFWVLKEINVVKPDILVVEYNSRFGAEKAVTVPYRDDFDRTKAHHSYCYFGASLAAFSLLLEERGYDLVGCGQDGVNAFFIRKDKRPKSLPALTPKEAFIAGDFRESRNPDGSMAYLTREEEIRQIEGLPLTTITKKNC